MKEAGLIIAAALFFLCIGILFFFRLPPTGKLWRDYTVFYTENTVKESAVLDVFTRAGLTDVLSLSHEAFPPVSPFAPVQYQAVSQTFSYDDLQTAFFSDKDNRFRLYYVPEAQAEQAFEALKHADFKWDSETLDTSPFWVPAAVCVYFLCFVFFAKNRSFFAASFFPFVCYIFAAPFYHIASFVILFGFSLFIAQKIWSRLHFYEKLFSQRLFTGSLLLLTAASAFSGLHVFLLLCAALAASVAAVYALGKIESLLRRKRTFYLHPISSARIVQTQDLLRLRFAVIPALFVSVFAVCTFIYVPFNMTHKNISTHMYLPAPVKKTMQSDFSLFSYRNVSAFDVENRLPDLTDFVHAFWFVETYPFRKLEHTERQTPHIGEKLEYINYKKNAHSLQELPLTVAIFDEAYIRRAADIARGQTGGQGRIGGAQTLLARQKGFVRTAHVRAGGGQNGIAVFVFTLCAFIYILLLLGVLGIKRLI